MRKTILFIAALLSLVSAAGCRRVVILSFNAPHVPDVDRLFVEGINPKKSQRELSGLGQTIGYYDVSTTSITVRVTACASGGRLVSDHQDEYKIQDDEVTIPIEAMIDVNPIPPPPCLGGLPTIDGGSNDGGAGGQTTGGMGGDAAGGTGGGAGGAGVAGAAGNDGGSSDTGDCGTDTHAPVCEPPSGDAGTSEAPPPISPECIQYCSDMHDKCASVYDSTDSCQRYCSLAGWAATGTAGNSLECRNNYLSPATQTTPNCANAGPGGNASCGYLCPNFCAAWIGICNRDPSEASACLTACTTKVLAAPTAEPACRFQLLQRALYDKRYCEYVKFDSCLSCE